jgi:exosortase
VSSRRNRRKAPPLTRVGQELARRPDSKARARVEAPAERKPKRIVEPINPMVRMGVGVALLVAFIFAYSPTFVLLQSEWERLPDYSHGYLVIPFALVLGWLRKDSMPGFSPGFSVLGLAVIGLAVAMRWFGDAYFYPVIGNNSLVLWAIGAVWFLFGARYLWWALPSLLFLGFMVPLPSRFSDILSGTLQRIATMMSTWMLQLFGQPALAEGNTISLGDHMLEVAQACSGLRIFVGIMALAFFVVFMARRRWWQNAAVIASILPIALVANTLRIVFTGLFMEWYPGEETEQLAHDVAGWVMIPLAVAMFAAFMWYLSQLIRPVSLMELGELRQISPNSKKGKPVAASN